MANTRKARNPNFIDWRKSSAREKIIQDLQPGGFLHNNKLDAAAAFEHYSKLPQFNGVCWEQFRDRLRDHRKQQQVNPTRSKFIGWRKSVAREILLQDLTPPHGILIGHNETSIEDLWEFYKTEEGFEKVPFEQFKLRLKDHRKQTNGNFILSAREFEYLRHDREISPRALTDVNGKPIWHMHRACKLLRKDIEKNRHVEKTPLQLQIKRKEYKAFEYEIFKNQFYAAIKRKKFINYLEMKRAVKRKGIKMRDRDVPNPIKRARKREDDSSLENPTSRKKIREN